MNTTTVWACIDCLQFAAGFDEHERGEAYPPETALAFLNMDGEVSTGLPPAEHSPNCGVLDGECGQDCETITFSSDRCGWCLSALAGSRHALTVTA